MTSAADDIPIWTPDPARAARSSMAAFVRHVRERVPDARVSDYDSLRAWSVAHPERFWPEVWRFCGVVAEPARAADADPWDEVVVGLGRMAPPDPERGPSWFTGARLNFAENLLRFRDDREALVSWSEQGRRGALTYAELFDAVGGARRALERSGVGAGDRVAGWMPNIPETVVAMLGAASLGAVWSSCSPDFGVRGVLDRFGQIAPRVLVCADGYRYAGKEIDCLTRLREIVAGLPDVERVVVVPWLRDGAAVAALIGDIRGVVVWGEWVGEAGEPGTG
jgi:acetoacetyl-CoA synthetase